MNFAQVIAHKGAIVGKQPKRSTFFLTSKLLLASFAKPGVTNGFVETAALLILFIPCSMNRVLAVSTGGSKLDRHLILRQRTRIASQLTSFFHGAILYSRRDKLRAQPYTIRSPEGTEVVSVVHKSSNLPGALRKGDGKRPRSATSQPQRREPDDTSWNARRAKSLVRAASTARACAWQEDQRAPAGCWTEIGARLSKGS